MSDYIQEILDRVTEEYLHPALPVDPSAGGTR